VPDETLRPQLISYAHSYNNFGHEVDWMGFIDGDEFLYPTKEVNLADALAHFQYEKLSALAIWWACYGSGGHIAEPQGYIIKNYIRRPQLTVDQNHHIKSLVRGHQGSQFSVGVNSHIFNTILGTRDENFREIMTGYVPDMDPSYNHFRINHYVCQSFEFFKGFKQNSGAADAGALAVRSDLWWKQHDINEVEDIDILKFFPAVEQLINEIDISKPF